MGWTSEMVAETYKVSRQKQDEYALISHTRAAKVHLTCRLSTTNCLCTVQAVASGIFADEILPIEVKGITISVDDTIRPGVTLESLSALKPAFSNWGEASTTAGNASGVGDGAALCILTTRERALADGMEIVGKWVGSALVGRSRFSLIVPSHEQYSCILGVQPRYMGIAPIFAIPKLLSQIGLSKEDIDIFEVSTTVNAL